MRHKNVVVRYFVRTKRVSYSISIRQWRYYCSDLVKCRCRLVRCGRTGLLSVYSPWTLDSWSWLFTHSDQPMSGFTAPSLYPFRFWTLCHSIFSSWYISWNTGFCSTYLYLRISSDLSIRLQRINPVKHYNLTVGLSIQEHLLSHIHYQGYYRNVLDTNKFNDQFLDTFFV